MERGYRDLSRASLAAAEYDYGSYERPSRGVSGYLDREPPLRESYLGSSSSSSYRSARSSYDREIMDSLIQQRALQQQLSLRESQLALASSLLHQQQQQHYFNKRRMDGPRGDYRDDFKRPRLMDNRSRPRNRLTGRDSYAGGRARGTTRGASGSRRIQSSPRHGQSSADNSKTSKDGYDPEKSRADEESEIDVSKLQCKMCNVHFKNKEELEEHRGSSRHKENMASARTGTDPNCSKWFCHVCDVPLNVTFLHHQRMTFHKKRKIQVMKGCGWCKVTSFKNFSEVLAHRATAEHIKHADGKSTRKERERIKVEMPPELTKFDPKAAVGSSVIVAVTGWFCKLCNKFYNSESAAKETHCMTELHFNNYKTFMYNKLKAKAEEERDAKEKAEEEERKKKEAEAAAAAQTEGGDGKAADGTAAEQTADGQGTTADGGEEEGVEEEMEVGEKVGEEEAACEEDGEEEGGWGEEYRDEAAAEENVQEGGEDKTEAVDAEGDAQEDEPMATEDTMEGEGEADETQEEVVLKKATRATVGSPGRGRGAGNNRARRGRRIAK